MKQFDYKSDRELEPLLSLPEGRRLVWFIGISALVLFICSSVRHALFQSNAFDMGTFDQAVYLISQGKPPISSFLEFHILSDHASFVFYPLALPYKIYPNTHWLLAFQAIALTIGAIPIWYLARLAGLAPGLSLAVGTAYLLYPLLFNVNLADFRPDVPILASILWAALFAMQRRLGWFCLAIGVALLSKEAFALTVAAMGIWLWFAKRRLYGAIAFVAGIAWFVIATQVIIPFFGKPSALVERQLERYNQLGNSVPEIALNLLLHPGILLGQVFTSENLFYLFLLVLPVAWGIHWRHLLPLIGAVPPLVLNLLSHHGVMKDLLYQYSLPIVPFLFLAIISALAAGQAWIRGKRLIILWSLVSFLALAKFGYFGSRYLKELDTWQATQAAIAQVPPQTSLLTTSRIAPHLTHRPMVRLAWNAYENFDLTTLPEFETVLLNARHPGSISNPELINEIVRNLQADARFQLQFQQDDVYLFNQK